MRMLVRSLQENQAPLRWRGWEAGVDREALSEKLTPGLSLRPPAISQGKGGGTAFMKGGSFKRSLACPAPAPDPSVSATQGQACTLGLSLEVKEAG